MGITVGAGVTAPSLQIRTRNRFKYISLSAVVRRTSKCPLVAPDLAAYGEMRHKFGASGCKCYQEDLGVIAEKRFTWIDRLKEYLKWPY